MLTSEKLLELEGFRDIICYHAQQAVEKFLKAYLIWFDIEFPKTHVLENLIELLREMDSNVENWKESAAMLSAYAVEIRYPGFDVPTKNDTQKAVTFADHVYKYLKEKILP